MKMKRTPSRQTPPPPPRRLNPRRAVPLHAQVEQELRRMLALPEFQNGALLPDELRLANRFGVSRGTLRAGIAQLVHEGLIERKAGVGTRVRPPAAESGIGAWRSFSREMARKGIQVENFQEGYQRLTADEAAAGALQIKPGTKLWRLDRVRGWNRLLVSPPPRTHGPRGFYPAALRSGRGGHRRGRGKCPRGICRGLGHRAAGPTAVGQNGRTTAPADAHGF